MKSGTVWRGWLLASCVVGTLAIGGIAAWATDAECYILDAALCAASQRCGDRVGDMYCRDTCGGKDITGYTRDDACVKVTSGGNKTCKDDPNRPANIVCYTEYTCVDDGI